MSYATVEALREYLPQVKTGQASDDLLQTILDRATQIIDTELGFAFGTAAVGTRTVYGDGTDYLIPPHFTAESVTAVTAPAGYTVPDYVETDGALVVTRGGLITPLFSWATLAGRGYGRVGGWQQGVPYVVAATFGYTSVPADIVECCLEIAVRIWRARDAGFSDVVGVEGAGAVGYNGSLPAMVKRILGHYQAGSSVGVH